jgi:hypothetical protein
MPNSILTVFEVTEAGEPTLLFDKRADAIEHCLGVLNMSLWCLNDTVTVTITQKEMTWSDYHKISLEEL